MCKLGGKPETRIETVPTPYYSFISLKSSSRSLPFYFLIPFDICNPFHLHFQGLSAELQLLPYWENTTFNFYHWNRNYYRDHLLV